MKIIYNEKYKINMFEIDFLKSWFNEEYSQKEQKLRRLRTLNLLCDDGSDPYNSLIELYNEAEIKRKRIQEIEKLLEQKENKGENIDA